MKIFRGYFIAIGRVEETAPVLRPKTSNPARSDRWGRYGKTRTDAGRNNRRRIGHRHYESGRYSLLRPVKPDPAPMERVYGGL